MESFKDHVLASTKEAVRAGGTVEGACRFYGIAKSTWYAWEKESNAKKLGVKKVFESHHPKKLTEVVEQNIIEKAKKYLAISSRYAVGFLCGVSATTVGKVLRKFGLTKTQEEKKQDRTKLLSYEWLKKDICWSIDTVYLRFKGVVIYLLVLRDEFSRMPLSISFNFENTAKVAAELVLRTIKTYKRKPLVVKKDRGSEFKKEFEELLREECIVALTSPGFYPKFNGKHEWGNRLFRKVEKQFAGKESKITIFLNAVQDAVDFEANTLPRKMFNGKTSREVYEGAESYTEEEKKAFWAKLLEVKDEFEKRKEQKKKDMLDVQRICVVKSLIDVKLCEVRMRENANQLSVCGVRK